MTEMQIYKRNVAALGTIFAHRFLSQMGLLEFMDDSDEVEDEEANTLNTDRRRRRITNVPQIVSFTFSNAFEKHFGLNRRTFEFLLPLVEKVIKKPAFQRHRSTSTEVQLLSTLWILSSTDTYKSVSDRFHLSKSGLSVSFFRVVKALNRLSPSFIKWPKEHECERIMQDFKTTTKTPNVIGAIGTLHISCRSSSTSSRAKDLAEFQVDQCRSTDATCALAMQATCLATHEFTTCFIGYPARYSNSVIFMKSDLFKDVEERPTDFFYAGKDVCVVGDTTFPSFSWCKTYDDENSGEVSKATFALLLGRFRKLRDLDMQRLDLMPATVLACCVIHNVCLLKEEGSRSDEYIIEGLPFVKGSDEEF